MERKQALDMAVGQIEKQYGKGAIMRLGERGNVGVEAISTGALALDLALGIGGLPRGRVVEIFGPEASGKSTLAMHVVAEAQRNGGVCAYIDAEHAMDPVYAAAIGVNVDDLYISQPDTGEQGLEIADMLIRSGAVDVVVIDSVAALVPRAEIEGEMGDHHVGLQARLMSQALRKLTANLNRSRTICVFINQLREKIGVIYGSPETTPGGRALKFYSSVRLDIRRVESIKDGAEVVGNRTQVKVVKNKVSAPFKQAEFDIMYGAGISREGSLLDVAVDLGIAKKSGAWYTYEGEQLGQGRENAKQFLTENVDVMVQISEKIRAAVGLDEDAVDVTEDATETRRGRVLDLPPAQPGTTGGGSSAPATGVLLLQHRAQDGHRPGRRRQGEHRGTQPSPVDTAVEMAADPEAADHERQQLGGELQLVDRDVPRQHVTEQRQQRARREEPTQRRAGLRAGMMLEQQPDRRTPDRGRRPEHVRHQPGGERRRRRHRDRRRQDTERHAEQRDRTDDDRQLGAAHLPDDQQAEHRARHRAEHQPGQSPPMHVRVLAG